MAKCAPVTRKFPKAAKGIQIHHLPRRLMRLTFHASCPFIAHAVGTGRLHLDLYWNQCRLGLLLRQSCFRSWLSTGRIERRPSASLAVSLVIKGYLGCCSTAKEINRPRILCTQRRSSPPGPDSNQISGHCHREPELIIIFPIRRYQFGELNPFLPDLARRGKQLRLHSGLALREPTATRFLCMATDCPK